MRLRLLGKEITMLREYTDMILKDVGTVTILVVVAWVIWNW